MTNNPTIDGVSRELLQQLASESQAVRNQATYALRAFLAAPVVERQLVAWSTAKPDAPGAYWIRGFNLSGEFNEAALVQVVLDEDAQVLMVNLHQSTTETYTGYWYEVDDINDGFEWSGKLYTAPPEVAALQTTIDQLQAQLAERDALLRDAMASHGVMLMTDPPQDPWKTRRISERIRAALSASAEVQ